MTKCTLLLTPLYYVRMSRKSKDVHFRSDFPPGISGKLMQLSIVILNWNAAADTIRCVRSIMAWSQLKPAIWVVDNASSDSSAEIIASECPQVHVIRNSHNQGFAG